MYGYLHVNDFIHKVLLYGFTQQPHRLTSIRAMEVLRRYATDAPDQRTWIETKPTFIVSWWCTCFSITIILFRIFGRYVRTEKIYLEDGIMMLAIIPLLLRMALVHTILMFGTNNSLTLGLTSEEIRLRRIGSQLVLVSRIMYAA